MVVSMKDVLHCESEYNRGAGCGKTARPDLYGGLCVNEVPTMTVLNGYSMRLSTLLIFLFMVVSCSSQHKGAPSTEISFEGKNKLKVKDVLIAYALGVPRPELGTSKNEIEQQLSVSLGTVLKKEQEYIKVRYITLGSQYADEEEYCDFIYYFLYDRLSRGPIVIEKCQNIKIMGLVRKKT
jgi:hypothetical protein